LGNTCQCCISKHGRTYGVHNDRGMVSNVVPHTGHMTATGSSNTNNIHGAINCAELVPTIAVANSNNSNVIPSPPTMWQGLCRRLGLRTVHKRATFEKNGNGAGSSMGSSTISHEEEESSTIYISASQLPLRNAVEESS
jgi:hypothetical protein